MALSNMIFTNNLGTITMTRIMYSLNHSYTWNGGSGVRSSIDISVTGNIKNSEADFSAIIGTMTSRGQRGTLTLPNKIYSNVKIVGISFQGETWTPWGVVSITFSDETEDGSNKNISTLTDGTNSFIVYEPRLVVKPSSISLSEKTIHMFDGYFRQKLGYDFLKIGFSGIVLLDSSIIPDSLFSVLEQKNDNGLPRVGNLSSFIPETDSNINPSQVMISDANIGWRVEKNSATVSINFIAPPQILGGNVE